MHFSTTGGSRQISARDASARVTIIHRILRAINNAPHVAAMTYSRTTTFAWERSEKGRVSCPGKNEDNPPEWLSDFSCRSFLEGEERFCVYPTFVRMYELAD